MIKMKSIPIIKSIDLQKVKSTLIFLIGILIVAVITYQAIIIKELQNKISSMDEKINVSLLITRKTFNDVQDVNTDITLIKENVEDMDSDIQDILFKLW